MGKIENDHQYLVTHKRWYEFSQSAFKVKQTIGNREPSILEKVTLDAIESVRDELREELDVYDKEHPSK